MRKPTPTDFQLVTEAAVRGLPESIAQRRETLAALMAVLPDGEERDAVTLMREHLVQHEREQMKFLDVLAGAKGVAR